MPQRKSSTTRLSTKGQIVLPKAIRERLGWKPGSELMIEQRAEGLLLRPARGDAKVDEVFGCLGPVGWTASIEDMNRGVLEEARRRWARKGL